MDIWTTIKTQMPAVGEPIMIKIGGTIQHLSYVLDGCDEGKTYWFEPHWFEHEDNEKVAFSKVTEWVYIEDLM